MPPDLCKASHHNHTYGLSINLHSLARMEDSRIPGLLQPFAALARAADHDPVEMMSHQIQTAVVQRWGALKAARVPVSLKEEVLRQAFALGVIPRPTRLTWAVELTELELEGPLPAIAAPVVAGGGEAGMEEFMEVSCMWTRVYACLW